MSFSVSTHNFTNHLLLLRRIEVSNPSPSLIIIENMQSNPSPKQPRRSAVRSLLQHITKKKKKDTEKEYPAFLNVSAETDVFPDFFASMDDYSAPADKPK